jgi:flagellar biosynthesis protein FliQ
MTTAGLSALFHEGMMQLAIVGGPLMAALLLVGLVLGVLQSATQIQEPSVGAVPRIATVVVMAILIGPWMVERLARFLHVAIERMGAPPL